MRKCGLLCAKGQWKRLQSLNEWKMREVLKSSQGKKGAVVRRINWWADLIFSLSFFHAKAKRFCPNMNCESCRPSKAQLLFHVVFESDASRESLSESLNCWFVCLFCLRQVTETRTGPLGCSNYDNLDSVSSVLVQSPENKVQLQGWSNTVASSLMWRLM